MVRERDDPDLSQWQNIHYRDGTQMVTGNTLPDFLEMRQGNQRDAVAGFQKIVKDVAAFDFVIDSGQEPTLSPDFVQQMTMKSRCLTYKRLRSCFFQKYAGFWLLR